MFKKESKEEKKLEVSPFKDSQLVDLGEFEMALSILNRAVYHGQIMTAPGRTVIALASMVRSPHNDNYAGERFYTCEELVNRHFTTPKEMHDRRKASLQAEVDSLKLSIKEKTDKLAEASKKLGLLNE